MSAVMGSCENQAQTNNPDLTLREKLANDREKMIQGLKEYDVLCAKLSSDMLDMKMSEWRKLNRFI